LFEVDREALVHVLRRRHVGGLLGAAAQAFERPDVTALVPLVRSMRTRRVTPPQRSHGGPARSFGCCALRSNMASITRHFGEMIFNAGQVPRGVLNARARVPWWHCDLTK